MNKCLRCEYELHDYENGGLCPKKDRSIQILAELDYHSMGIEPVWYGDISKNCENFEDVRAPMSWWTKKEIIRVCRDGGANRKTVEHMEKIKLNDLRVLLLRPMGMEPRGNHHQIFFDRPQDWTEVRHTKMFTIDWDLIDNWNRNLS